MSRSPATSWAELAEDSSVALQQQEVPVLEMPMDSLVEVKELKVYYSEELLLRCKVVDCLVAVPRQVVVYLVLLKVLEVCLELPHLLKALEAACLEHLLPMLVDLQLVPLALVHRLCFPLPKKEFIQISKNCSSPYLPPACGNSRRQTRTSFSSSSKTVLRMISSNT